MTRRGIERATPASSLQMPIRTAIQNCLIIRLGAPARPEPLRIQATWRRGLLDVDSGAAAETLDDPF
jgi:hypothetical protein